MGLAGLPSWLPDRVGAEAAVTTTVRAHAQELVDLVLAEDTVYLDALPEPVESAIISPLAVLAEALEKGTDVEVVVAARLVRRTAAEVLAAVPEDLRALVERLPPPAT